MHTLASAAGLLDACVSVPSAAAVLHAIGFEPELIELGREHLDALGLTDLGIAPHLARGTGSLRALVFEPDNESEIRHNLDRVARRLAVTAPQFLWVICAFSRRSGEIAVAGLDAGDSRHRIAALVTRRGRVTDSDAETLCALAAGRVASDVMTHCRWLEVLGRESVSRQFFRSLQGLVIRLAAGLDPPVREPLATELALTCVSRLLFLAFLETKGWLDGDHGFLGNRFADCMVTGGRYHQRVLNPLFFGTLNTDPHNRAPRSRAFGRIPFLNGGLFARSTPERCASRSFFPDDVLGDVFGDLFSRYRFTAREDSRTWSEAAIDPEMLGKAFESLMSAAARKTSGAFYTPQSLVRDVTALALADSLDGMSLRELDELRLLDPACGSGAFLVHALEELARIRLKLGDTRQLHLVRRQVLSTSIFGVDINPTATWLCELRLWLSMAIEDPERNPMRVTRLPNLDRNIRVGDSLSGEDFGATRTVGSGRWIGRLRLRYTRASGPRKRSLAIALDKAERGRAIAGVTGRLALLRAARRDILAVARSHDLFGQRRETASELEIRRRELRSSIREAERELNGLESDGALPFSFPSGFADVADRGGFDLVLGNPPWIRTHHLRRSSRAVLRASFDVYRNSAWRDGGDAAAAGRGFASQVDSAALFVERSVKLLRPGGTCALIVPSKLWRSLAGGGVRDFLLSRTIVREIQDLGSGDRTFDAAVYPSVILTRRNRNPIGGVDIPAWSPITVVAHRGGQLRKWCTSPEKLGLDASRGSPWILVPAEARRAFDAMSQHGLPLARSHFGRPLLGVKTGCNDAFVVTVSESRGDEDIVTISNAVRTGTIERLMLRPVIRGESLRPWRIPSGASRIIWTHDGQRRALGTLPPGARRWLGHWRADLASRSDARGKARWWTLFRTEGSDCSRPRVVWADIGKSPRAAVIAAGDPAVPLNTCYIVPCADMPDALALAAILNSRLAAAWLDIIAEPARGGYRRYMGWTMAALPVPREWERARTILSQLANKAVDGQLVDAAELDAAVADAYRLTPQAIAPLLAWRE